jgi:chromosomal replication initiation ATPase DnaA
MGRGMTSEDDTEAFDERILGSGEFVERVRAGGARLDGRPRMSVGELMERAAVSFGTRSENLSRRCRGREIVNARNIICYFAVREMGQNGVEIGKMLNLSRSGVSLAADRGEAMVRSNPSLRRIVTSLQ